MTLAARRHSRQSVPDRPDQILTAEMTKYLQDVLGQRLVAVIAGIGDVGQVSSWASAENAPPRQIEQRLLSAYQVAQLLMQREDAETVRAWFRGSNPHLGDDAPALALASQPG